jgi:translocation and assembly module TamB
VSIVARILGLVLRILRDVGGALLTLVVAALVFLLFTEAGARLALREVESRLGLIQAEDVRGRLWGPLRFARLRYEDDFVRVEVEDGRLDWAPLQLLLGNVVVTELQAQALHVDVKPGEVEDAAGDDGEDSMLTQLPVTLDLSGLRIGRIDIQLPDGEPLQFGSFAFDGSWRGPRLQIGELSAQTPWVGALRVHGALTLEDDGIAIAGLDIGGFAEARLEGRYGYATPSDLRLSWTALRWPPQADGVGEPEISSDGGSLHWQGTIDDWRYEIDAALAAAGEALDITAAGSGSLEQVRAQTLRVDSGHARVVASATLQLDPLALDASGRLENLQPQRWVPDLDGLIQGDFSVQAAFAGEQPDVQFDVRLDRSQLQGYAADLDARGRYRDGRLQLEQADLRAGDNRVRASGQVLPELDLELRIDAARLDAILPQLGGRLRARLQLKGPLDLPRTAGSLRASGLRYEDYVLETLDADFDLDATAELRLDARLAGVDVGTRLESLVIGLRGPLSQHRLALDAVLPQARVELAVEGGLEGVLDGAPDWQNIDWRGRLASARLTPRDFPTFELEEAAPLQLRGDVVTLDPACFTASIARFCAGLRPIDGGRRAAFRLENFDLAAIEPWLPGGVQAQGRIDGYGYVDLGDAGLLDLRLDLNSSPLRLTRGGMPPLALLPCHVRATEVDGSLQIEAALPFERGGLQLEVQLGAHDDFLQRPLRGELRAEIPELSWLQLFSYELQDVVGRLDGRIAIDGSLATPRFDGAIELADAGLRLRKPGIRLERVRASFAGGSEGVLRIDAEAWSDDGPLRIDGELDPWSDPLALQLRVRGERFQALRIPDATIWISPQLDVRLARGELRVDGSVDVPRADITPKNIDSGVGPSGDQVIVRRGDDAQDADAIGIHANIELRLGDEVRFDGFGLSSRLRGRVRVIEAPGVPTRARGELQLVDGRYKAYGQDLNIENGRLLFTGGALTDPAVELRATRKPREDITVGVLVRGTLDKPEFSLFSTPTMPQERQLSWLVLGRAIDDGGGSATERELVANAALGLGLAGGEWLAQRLGGRIGFDEISLGARPGETSDQARLTVGKYLSPKLFISYGVGLFQPGSSFRLQYDIGRGFKLATETGVESGGDLLYTIER